MKKHILQPKSSDIFIPISIAILLIIGIIISIVQSQQPQQNRSSAQTAIKNCDVPPSELSLSAIEMEMFQKINAYRKEKGLNELYYNQTLQRGAQWMSNDMAAHNNLDHTDSLGRDVGSRLKDCGLSERSWGENISEGYQTVQKAFDAWKGSPPHNANMLGNFTHMGIAEKNTFWTLDLAQVANGSTSPPPTSGGTPVPTVSTGQPNVTLQPTANPTAVPTPTIPKPTGPPDLTVADMQIATNGDTCGPLGLLVSIKNLGGKTTLPVIVQANTTIGTIGGGIDAGETKTLWLQNYVNGENSVTVDPSSSITEANETNNKLKRTLTVPTKPASCSITPTSGVRPTSSVRPTGTDGLTPTPTNYPGFVLNPNDTQVLVSVKLPGIGINGNTSPKHLSRRVTVSVYDLENEKVFEGVGFLTYDKKDLFRGIIHLGKGINSTYYVKVASDHTLQELVMPQFQPLLNDRLNGLSPVVLITGDMNADNQLTIADYNIALECFQDKKCNAKPKTDANGDGTVNVYDSIDFNDDGKVNVVDYNYFLHNFKEFGGD